MILSDMFDNLSPAIEMKEYFMYFLGQNGDYRTNLLNYITEKI